MKRLAAFFLLLGLAPLGLVAADAASGQASGPNFWLHCLGSPLSCNEEPVPTVTETDTVTETTTVTDTVPPPPPPPTTTEPPASVACRVSNRALWAWQDCEAGTTIMVTNALWFCNQPLASYGDLPIKLVARWTQTSPRGQNGIELRSGCVGDGTDAIDLIVDFDVSGAGRVSDIFKTRMVPGPQSVDVTGKLAACGPPAEGDHQDAAQFQGGNAITLTNMDAGGDYEGGEALCQGAGGIAFYSINESNVSIYGGTWIGCNHSLNVHAEGVGNASRIEGAKFRSGNTSTAFCSAFFGSPACVGALDQFELFQGVTCQRWNGSAWVDQ